MWRKCSRDSHTTLIADRAYEGNKIRALAKDLGYNLCIPPKSNRKKPWEYDAEFYRCRNEIERLFRRVKNIGKCLPGMTSWMSCTWDLLRLDLLSRNFSGVSIF